MNFFHSVYELSKTNFFNKIELNIIHTDKPGKIIDKKSTRLIIFPAINASLFHLVDLIFNGIFPNIQ